MRCNSNFQKSINQKIKLYSTLTLSSLATKGFSQISYTDIKDSVLVNHGDFFDIDLNNDGTNDLRITITKNTFTSTSSRAMTSKYTRLRRVTASDNVSGGDINATQVSSSGNQGYAVAFSLNNQISSGINSWAPSAIMVNQEVVSNNSSPKASYTSGNFDGVRDAYLGVRFDLNGSKHYGWVRLDVASGVDSVIIKDYAYEKTAATDIEAGDTGSVAVGLSENVLKHNDIYIAQGDIQLRGEILVNSEMRIYDLTGKLVQEEAVRPSTTQIGLRNDYNGVYVVELRSGKSILRKKLWLGAPGY